MDTQLRSQTKTDVTDNEAKVSELYCISHERMVHVEHGVCGIGHKIEVNTDEGKEVDFCCFEGGYAFVPPSTELDDLPLDWANQPDQLSEDERAQAELAEQGMWLAGYE